MRHPIILFLTIFTILFASTGCEKVDNEDPMNMVMPYFLLYESEGLEDLKPVFLILVDQSGSNSEYSSSIDSLAEDSRSYILENLYDNDEQTMDERFAVLPYSNGEGWSTALTAEPTTLSTNLTTEHDEHTSRVILFYGNGSGASTVSVRDNYYSEINAFLDTTYSELDLYMGRLVITPNSDNHYTDWAECAVNGTAYNATDSIDGCSPAMKDYGWDYSSYDPTSKSLDSFLEELFIDLESEYNK